MSSAELDSSAEFKRRAEVLGLAQPIIDALTLVHLDSFGRFAFSIAYSPGQQDDTAFTDLATRLNGGIAMPAGQLAGLRRWFWESHTLALADLKHRTEHGTDAVNKKLPTAERQARANEQRTRLVGVTWGPDSEPSHQLVDRFVAMCEENVISYVKPELCTSRAQEILSSKQSQSFSLSSDGNLRVKGHESDLECTVTGEMKLREAFRRRALAMDLAQMVTYTVSEEWHAFLFLSIQREPPKGFRPINLGQIIAADRRLWVLVSEATRGNVVATGGAAKPCDAVVSTTSAKPEVMNFLSPLPILPDKSETVHRSEPYNTTKGKGKGKGKDGKHQAAHNDNYLPDGCVLKKPDGKPLCGLYNKGRCWQKNVKPNGRCAKGFHQCFKAGCHRPKPFHECTHTD